MGYNRLLIRADGNAAIGLGHIMRCIALASFLKNEFQSLICLVHSDSNVRLLIETRGIAVKMMRDEEMFFGDIKGSDIVVLDGYSFDTEYQKRIKDLNVILVCIDDLHKHHFLADVVINHAPCVKREQYDAELYTHFLLGTEYALLRPVFRKQAGIKRKIGKISNVLICFGGADSKNLTSSALDVILASNYFTKIKIITGVTYPFICELRNKADTNSNIELHHNLQDEQIVGELKDIHLAIVPASGILFEMIACGIPTISGYYVDNQRDIYKGFLSMGAIYDASNFEAERLSEALSTALNTDPNEMIERQAACIDGMAGDRYLDFFRQFK